MRCRWLGNDKSCRMSLLPTRCPTAICLLMASAFLQNKQTCISLNKDFVCVCLRWQRMSRSPRSLAETSEHFGCNQRVIFCCKHPPAHRRRQKIQYPRSSSYDQHMALPTLMCLMFLFCIKSYYPNTGTSWMPLLKGLHGPTQPRQLDWPGVTLHGQVTAADYMQTFVVFLWRTDSVT